ncbi:bacteriocin-like protein [Chitinophaga pendula]|uniref:bacteriocin-like protein n=1 Tax=Chitinophaga pendula TaxID=2849666 RepID=UPI0026D40BBC
MKSFNLFDVKKLSRSEMKNVHGGNSHSSFCEVSCNGRCFMEGGGIGICIYRNDNWCECGIEG